MLRRSVERRGVEGRGSVVAVDESDGEVGRFVVGGG